MENKEDIAQIINDKISTMSKGQKKISQFILTQYEKAAFMTAAEIGNEVGVSESTVVRYAVLLGFDGFPKFQKSLENMVHSRLNTVKKIEIDKCNQETEDLYKNIFAMDIEKIRQLSASFEKDVFDYAVNSIIEAENIYIVGVRNSSPVASYLGFYLNMIRKNVKIISSCNESEIFEQMIHISNKDLLIGISFPRYSMRTLKAMEFANDKTAKVISITDTKHSPINLYSSCNLLAATDMTNIMDSLVAPMALVNAILVAVSMKLKNEIFEIFDQVDKIFENYRVSGSDEMNLFDDSMDIKL